MGAVENHAQPWRPFQTLLTTIERALQSVLHHGG
jgi:hypothetical protein